MGKSTQGKSPGFWLGAIIVMGLVIVGALERLQAVNHANVAAGEVVFDAIFFVIGHIGMLVAMWQIIAIAGPIYGMTAIVVGIVWLFNAMFDLPRLPNLFLAGQILVIVPTVGGVAAILLAVVAIAGQISTRANAGWIVWISLVAMAVISISWGGEILSVSAETRLEDLLLPAFVMAVGLATWVGLLWRVRSSLSRAMTVILFTALTLAMVYRGSYFYVNYGAMTLGHVIWHVLVVASVAAAVLVLFTKTFEVFFPPPKTKKPLR